MLNIDTSNFEGEDAASFWLSSSGCWWRRHLQVAFGSVTRFWVTARWWNGDCAWQILVWHMWIYVDSDRKHDSENRLVCCTSDSSRCSRGQFIIASRILCAHIEPSPILDVRDIDFVAFSDYTCLLEGRIYVIYRIILSGGRTLHWLGYSSLHIVIVIT